ncbi:GNAT family N-acetyltransferase [Burkholderia oklahomensis]|uniref:Acetyltransferase domain protein n=1 Tax=Burkholderia oklahomensis TaxID=342113 RepID=A0AAI8B4M2_9BURK|nr:GNAT family N-acetyltransferase [Burkholderia oklahomensis]AIO65647.1 acetyltransferase domain protein [Burkholderia oklahomensis]AOI44054.1 acetyltransferase [Burkholderia oklahomensis EO147]KUY50861.1 acetyltransferase [Burkholderia oklahomensis EO147]QPS39171.1 GNAT family N-acetyltransferase [Burkholderia oklahomensis]
MIKAEHLEYRPMREDDTGAFYDVRFSVTENRIHPHQIHLLNRELLVEKIRQGGGWICECGNEAAGVCVPVITDTPFISALFVRPSFHGMGIGRELLERSLKWLRDRGATQVTLVTDPGSRADGFYQHLGWKRGELDEYGCQVILSKSLKD